MKCIVDNCPEKAVYFCVRLHNGMKYDMSPGTHRCEKHKLVSGEGLHWKLLPEAEYVVYTVMQP
jgi:hypothetical protein